MGEALEAVSTGTIIDLGSGGGLPGLPLAMARRDLEWILLEGSRTRATFLTEAVERLSLANTRVVSERAEVAARTPLRGRADAVVARSFGLPAITAECGAPFLRQGGVLVVAEPPAGQRASGRWDPDGLCLLGMGELRRSSGPTAWVAIRQVAPCPDRYPRRTGIPAKRPLF